MHYQQAIDYLFGLQKFGIKLGLHNITGLLAALGNPQRNLRFVHVAGTNGKGSTCAYLHAIFDQAGFSPGLYTSPHLIDFTERIRIKGRPIPRAEAAELISDLRRLCRRKSLGHITFFEFATALAFFYFKTQGADPVILETGLGGTHDATNVVAPVLTAITSIGLEHQHYLGKTLTAIASEKAGIIKPRIPLVCGATQPRVIKTLRDCCSRRGSAMFTRGVDFWLRRAADGTYTFRGSGCTLRGVRPGLAGPHQRSNASVAIAAADLLRGQYGLSDRAILEGIARARWPGRFELLGSAPAVVADGAHNPQGCRALVRTLAELYGPVRPIFIMGMLQDKDVAGMLKILAPRASALVLCRPDIGRAAGREHLENFISFSEKKKVFWYDNSALAYTNALSLAGENDLICITGSLFLVGELRQLILKKKGCPSGRIAL